ncbi:KOW motif-containing protein [Candidatus Pacearchaeota archaeon]|nr:KOW motif-containing protein [Candidatus Pacearchaeota archaeon]
MYQTRAETSKKLPIRRKGTKYIARPSSHIQNSIPVVIAIRDMLKLARTSKEVKHMIKNKSLKINGKEVKDYRESIKLLNIFEADKPYILTLTENNRFNLEPSKSKERICKVINKSLLNGNKIQLNLHDGSNILAKEKISTNDTIYLSPENKIIKTVSMEEGKECFVSSGKYVGKKGKIESVEENKVKVKLKEGTVELNKSNLIAI